MNSEHLLALKAILETEYEVKPTVKQYAKRLKALSTIKAWIKEYEDMTHKILSVLDTKKEKPILTISKQVYDIEPGKWVTKTFNTALDILVQDKKVERISAGDLTGYIKVEGE